MWNGFVHLEIYTKCIYLHISDCNHGNTQIKINRAYHKLQYKWEQN